MWDLKLWLWYGFSHYQSTTASLPIIPPSDAWFLDRVIKVNESLLTSFSTQTPEAI